MKTSKKLSEAYIFNSIPEINQKNIVIAISCNKKATAVIDHDLGKQIVEEGLNYTEKLVGIFIADEIMKFNEMAANMTPKKAEKKALHYGDHFFKLFSKIISELDEADQKRISIFRWRDLHDDKFQLKIDQVREIYEQDPEIKEAFNEAAKKLLKWRSPDFTPNEKRLNAILEYIFWEIPALPSFHGQYCFHASHHIYHGLLYPAINPKGMCVIASLVAKIDEVVLKDHPPQRNLLVIHLTHEGSLQVVKDLHKEFHHKKICASAMHVKAAA